MIKRRRRKTKSPKKVTESSVISRNAWIVILYKTLVKRLKAVLTSTEGLLSNVYEVVLNYLRSLLWRRTYFIWRHNIGTIDKGMHWSNSLWSEFSVTKQELGALLYRLGKKLIPPKAKIDTEENEWRNNSMLLSKGFVERQVTYFIETFSPFEIRLHQSNASLLLLRTTAACWGKVNVLTAPLTWDIQEEI